MEVTYIIRSPLYPAFVMSGNVLSALIPSQVELSSTSTFKRLDTVGTCGSGYFNIPTCVSTIKSHESQDSNGSIFIWNGVALIVIYIYLKNKILKNIIRNSQLSSVDKPKCMRKKWKMFCCLRRRDKESWNFIHQAQHASLMRESVFSSLKKLYGNLIEERILYELTQMVALQWLYVMFFIKTSFKVLLLLST